MGVLGLCLLFAVIYVCDTWLFSKGYSTFCHKHKTEEEKELRRLQIDLLCKELKK